MIRKTSNFFPFHYWSTSFVKANLENCKTLVHPSTSIIYQMEVPHKILIYIWKYRVRKFLHFLFREMDFKFLIGICQLCSKDSAIHAASCAGMPRKNASKAQLRTGFSPQILMIVIVYCVSMYKAETFLSPVQYQSLYMKCVNGRIFCQRLLNFLGSSISLFPAIKTTLQPLSFKS
ncbi:MAG: hypothetical protein CM1200mP28_00020 [Deltaproteobacteria bacterium]|nr:MAG: hypothetical protein CM1200mP28_00020 [Deltaproteobacteria bacterium]